LQDYVKVLKAKLGNEKFVSKAPPELVKAETAKLHDAEDKLRKIAQSLASLA